MDDAGFVFAHPPILQPIAKRLSRSTPKVGCSEWLTTREARTHMARGQPKRSLGDMQPTPALIKPPVPFADGYLVYGMALCGGPYAALQRRGT